MYRLYLAGALRVQPLVALRQGDLAATEHALEEGLSLARAMPYPHGEGRLLKVYGQLHLGIWPAANRRRRGCGWRRRIPSSADWAPAGWAPAGIWSTSSSCWLTRHGQTPMMCAATALSASRASYDYCEDQRIAYTIGLSRNTRLETLAAPLTEDAQRQRAQTGETLWYLLAARPNRL